MRHIPIDEVQIPDSWMKKSKTAFDAITRCTTSQERAKMLKKYARVWGNPELKTALESLSHGKCWYCESKDERSDHPVDHFRPKGAVSECADHEGYWWLAFDWTNYRLSCSWCNSQHIDRAGGKIRGQGKQDHFPLLDEAGRAKLPTDDLRGERPYLLDPTCSEDVELLWFRQDGMPIPKYSEVEDEEAYKRVETSIKIYHLDASKINERRMDLYNILERDVRHGDKMLENIAQNEDDESALEAFGYVVEVIKNKTAPAAEFSAAAHAYLLGLREAGREWLDVVLFDDEIMDDEQ